MHGYEDTRLWIKENSKLQLRTTTEFASLPSEKVSISGLYSFHSHLNWILEWNIVHALQGINQVQVVKVGWVWEWSPVHRLIGHLTCTSCCHSYSILNAFTKAVSHTEIMKKNNKNHTNGSVFCDWFPSHYSHEFVFFFFGTWFPATDCQWALCVCCRQPVGQRIVVCVRKRPLTLAECKRGEEDVVTALNEQCVNVNESKEAVDLSQYILQVRTL